MESSTHGPDQFPEAAHFHRELLRRARQLTGADAEARDLVQDTFERALRAARRPREHAEVRPWMMRLLRNLWIDRLRAARRRPLSPLTDELPSLAEHDEPAPAWEGLCRGDVDAALEEVPEPQRTIYRLHALEGRSYTELAATLGLRPGTIGTRLLRARHNLRRILTRRCAERRGEAQARLAEFA